MEDRLINILKIIKQNKKKAELIREKQLNINTSIKQSTKLSVDLNWLLMDTEKQKRQFCVLFKDSGIDIGTEETEFNPSGFHSYKF